MKTTNKINGIVLALAGAGLASIPCLAFANPTDGKVVAGNVTINQETATKVGITQTSSKGIIDWKTYSIGSNEHVQYYQPSASSVTLNRVVGQDPSQILGRLTANGQIFLVNPNGILFGKTAQVDVAGLVASTHNIRNEDFLAGRYVFNIPGNPGASVINEGTIRIADTGIAAFVAPSVANRGVIVAKLGKVALAAANGFTLDFTGDALLTFLVSDEVARTAFDIDGKQLTSFVENSGRIEAQGGYVLLTAKAAENAIHGVINQSGVIEARTVGTKNGEIILDAGKGSLNVSGTLDASAPNGGDGGFVETSGAQVFIAAGTRVTTVAPNGNTGTWLVDPVDFTIAATGGNMTGGQVHDALTLNNFTVWSTSGTTGTAGDINVNDAVNWSANKLTLNAQHNININADLTASGTAKLSLEYGQATANGVGSDYVLSNGAKVNLPAGQNFSTQQGSAGIVKNFNVITALGTAGSTNGNDLQGINGNPTGFYVLGSDIDAASTAGWNSGAGFDPIGKNATAFSGQLHGLGHVISNISINRPNDSLVGLFGNIAGSVRDIGVENASVIGGTVGGAAAGILAGNVSGVVSRAHVSGSIKSSATVGTAGGLIGTVGVPGVVYESYSSASVEGNHAAGGLVGYHFGLIQDSYATGKVFNNAYSAGGLVGINNGQINRSYSTGEVSSTSIKGGLVGLEGRDKPATTTNSYWDTETSKLATSGSGTGKTTAQMKQQATYAGWDFVDTWRIVEGSSYPMLRALTQGKITLTAPARDIEKVYDKTAWHGGIIDYSGFTAGDTSSNLSGTLQWVGTAEGAVNTGTYTLVPTGLYSQKYEVVYVPGWLTIQPRPVDVSVTKTYDGNATFTNGFTVTNGVVAGDASPAITGTATVSSANAGSYSSFTTNNLVSSNSNYTANPQYAYSGALGKVDATISQASVNLIKMRGEREYDGTSNAYANDIWLLNGVQAIDQGKVDVVSGIGLLDGKNVGTRQLVSTGSLQLGGDAARNYVLTATGSQWVISPKALDLHAVSDERVYDSTTISSKMFSVTGLVGDDSVTNRVQAFESKNVLGGNKSIIYVKSFSIKDGNEGSNYKVISHQATGTIVPYVLTIEGGAVVDKAHDGSRSAIVNGAYISPLYGDHVNLALTSAGYEDPYVGDKKKVYSYWELTGRDSMNYALQPMVKIFPGKIYGNFPACVLVNNCQYISPIPGVIDAYVFTPTYEVSMKINAYVVTPTYEVMLKDIIKDLETAWSNSDFMEHKIASPFLWLAFAGKSGANLAGKVVGWPVSVFSVATNSFVQNYGEEHGWDGAVIEDRKETAQTIIDVGSILFNFGKVISAANRLEGAESRAMDSFFEELSRDPVKVKALRDFETNFQNVSSKIRNEVIALLMQESTESMIETGTDLISTGGGKLVEMFNAWQKDKDLISWALN